MADTSKKDDRTSAVSGSADTGAGAARRMGVRLSPVNDSDQPVVANYTHVNLAPGMAFVDFGFLEPGLLNAIPRVARQGGKLPEQVNGRLAVRVAMGYDGLAALHEQLGRVLAGLRAAAKDKR